MGESKKNTHARHRERMRKKFAKYGFEAFTEHEKMEYMLFYAMPRGNTNEIAHRLEDEFGSLEAVVTAPRERLLSVKGIGENTVLYFDFLRKTSSLLRMRLFAPKSADDIPDVKEYFISAFMGINDEQVYAAGFDDNMNFVCGAKVADGKLGAVDSPARKIFEFVCASGCNRLIIAHNHPRSGFLPSPEDVYNTTDLVKKLRWLDVILMDHIIVGEGGAISLRGSMHAKDIWGVKED